MMSLKAFLPQLAGIFSTTPAALYERQRALVRLGILEATEGRGPGSGVVLSADNVAALIIAILVTDNLSDTDARVRKLADRRFDDRLQQHCKLTSAKTFRSAVAAVLGSQAVAESVSTITVQRSGLIGTISYERGQRRSTQLSNFGVETHPLPQFEVNATLHRQAVRKIGEALRASQ